MASPSETSAPSSSSYYDIDSILAEEDLVPCTTLFDFSHLAHLDPDSRRQQGVKQDSDDDSLQQPLHYLPEGSRIKLPLWAMEQWAHLGFCRLSLPRHYARKARERLAADPGDADLRKRNQRFYWSGMRLVELIEDSSQKVAKAIASSRRTMQRNQQRQALTKVMEEAIELRRTLQTTYSGERLRRTLDWALSSGDDDVSHYTNRLTEMERRLFRRGADAIAGHMEWTMYGNRRLGTAPAPAVQTASSKNPTPTAPVVTPNKESRRNDNDNESSKRRKLQ